ncbi:MAG: hypothetical protein IPM22_18025 [Betaproteobacteria bacterium]|nr:hypothetical protein [Betaproteobacteria bacterium]MCC7217747.1 hypothetical protein [Burkholderiales bacterium]
MSRWWGAAALAAWTCLAQAMSPYVEAPKVAAGDVKAAMADVERKLVAANFTVVGRYQPKGLSQYGIVVATDAGLTDAVAGIGGPGIVAAPLRVAVRADGTVFYANPEYWSRAYLGASYGKAEGAVKGAAARLAGAFGAGKPAGGDVKVEDLPGYRYMIGMEKFGDRSELNEFASFEQAVQTIRDNLAKGVGDTAQVYAIVLPERKLAVFGVALNNADYGEGWWVNKIGPDNAAALPWEIYVVDKHASALYGRYRTALGWPELGMGTFMTIVRHPDTTMQALEAAAGKKP